MERKERKIKFKELQALFVRLFSFVSVLLCVLLTIYVFIVSCLKETDKSWQGLTLFTIASVTRKLIDLQVNDLK